MADYSDAYKSACKYCGAWDGHTPLCGSPYMKKVRENQAARDDGFEPITDYDHPAPRLYKCKRGCGAVVWNMETHKKNVCRTNDN